MRGGKQRGTRVAGSLFLASWALYITVVTASNLSELLSSFHAEHWRFRSGNLSYIESATRIYFENEQVNQVLLALVTVWEAGAAVLLWLSAWQWARRSEDAAAYARSGLVLLGLLWFAFAISTELTVAYDRGVNESAYWTLAAALLATLLLLEMWSSSLRGSSQGTETPSGISGETAGGIRGTDDPPG
ncbi:DUF2165 family protein [Streptomyces cyaneofuscatus]|uniref:DUF2165 family protein n=1 Tax=Streptomyces cyaneofuscatus TaxID=66883 RepID=UPI0036635C86